MNLKMRVMKVIKKLRPFCRLKRVSYVTSPKRWFNKIKWVTCWLYFCISSVGNALPCCTCWNIFQGSKKCITGVMHKGNFPYSFSCPYTNAVWRFKNINKYVFVWNCPKLDKLTPDYLKTQEMCKKKLLKIIQTPWNLSLIILRWSRCVKKQLKMIQAP